MLPHFEITRVLRAIADRLPGGVLPESYTVVDLETSGLSLDTDRAVSVGFCAVEAKKSIWVSSRVLFRPALRLSERAVAIHGIDRGVMEARGEDPEVVYRDFVKTASGVIVGFNAHRFDKPLLLKDLETYSGAGAAAAFAALPLIDVGLVLKAALARIPVSRTDTLPTLYDRIAQTRANVRWSLDWACAELGITARPHTHDAGDDAERAHRVLEKLRAIAY